MPKAKLLQKSTKSLIGQEIGFINGLREQNLPKVGSVRGEKEWCLDKSKEPHHKPGKINKELERTIVESRKKLVRRDTPATKYSFCGAIAIHQKLDTMGFPEETRAFNNQSSFKKKRSYY